jgi:hypothetical protein
MNCIGPVRFLWKFQDGLSDRRALWIWCHPSTYKVIGEQLVRVFNLSGNKDVASGEQSEEKMETDTDENILSSNDEKNINLLCLKDKLVRFKLIGPMSTSVLANVLKTVSR